MTYAGNNMRRSRNGLFLGAALCAALGIQCQQVASHYSLAQSALVGPVVTTETRAADYPVLATVEKLQVDPLEAEAERAPLGFLQMVQKRCQEEIHDYRCTFTKQERVGRKVRPAETMHVMFMQEPYSVLMRWPASPRPAQRALYTEGKWTDSKGRALALIEPEPLLAKLFPRMKRPIDDRMARSKSRRRIDQFGFARSMDLIVDYSEMAKAEGALKLEYRGRSTIAGRSTYVFVRQLPYTGAEGRYPDRVLVVHIDEDYLVPTAVFTFADDLEKELLGTYITSDLELNVGLSPADFTLDG